MRSLLLQALELRTGGRCRVGRIQYELCVLVAGRAGVRVGRYDPDTPTARPQLEVVTQRYLLPDRGRILDT